jgi:endonuclease G, mitochondrial
VSRGSKRAKRPESRRATLGAVAGAIVAAIAAVAGGGTRSCSPGTARNDREPSRSNARPPGSAPPAGRVPSRRGGGASSPADGSTAPSVHLELGTPTDKDPSDDSLMIKPQYALSYSRTKNDPNWVSWNLNASYFGNVPRYKGKFLSDTTLPEGFYRVRHEDYVGSGFDRGHMVRSEERTRTDDDNRATFLLTNVLPQQHDMNAGPWLRLEEHCQDLAQKDNHELFIVAGGVFGRRPETIGNGVAVPESCFKIVVVLGRGQGAADVGESTRVIAVVMPDTTGIINNDWGRYATTVDEIERRTGYEFLSRVPEPVQAVIEGRVDAGPRAP